MKLIKVLKLLNTLLVSKAMYAVASQLFLMDYGVIVTNIL